jgi:ketosteroid isomerase-like protein
MRKSSVLVFVFLMLTQIHGMAQNAATPIPSLDSIQSQADLDKAVMALDTALFDAYNKCDLVKFRSLLADDVEFYHDKGGVTLGAEKLTESIKTNICGGDVLRELVPGTFEAHHMQGYGAIEIGTHRFLHPKSNGPAGEGKFITLWQYKDGSWKVTRALSFDHQQAK